MKVKNTITMTAATTSGFFAFFLADFEPLAKSIATVANADMTDPATAITWVSIYLRLNVFLLVGLITVVANLVYHHRRPTNLKGRPRFGTDDIVDEMKALETELVNLTISGYSLSFAQSIRHWLQENPKPDLVVKLLISSPAFLREYCKEEINSIDSRIYRQEAMVREWLDLERAGRVKKVEVYHFKSLAVEYSVSLDREVTFVGIYPWHSENGKHKLIKTPTSSRYMERLTSADGLPFEYMNKTLESRQIDGANHHYANA
ncbi:hypothetical protein [Nocardia noduli]|uniref:hypothetical protein n=1 Tax=Nocardia noduli TaxID=2815722 RepID=UPI001C2105E2|nr:hypothetical protein [Nocardia noduli]